MIVNRAASFADIQIIPPAFVGISRAALQAQGIDPRMIQDDGNLDPQALLAIAWQTASFRTSLTPAIDIDLTRKGDGQVSTLVKELQPVFELRGRVGNVTIAPAGVPTGINPNITPAATWAGVGVGLGLLGLLVIGKTLL
jgi:hypothetical protein